MSSSIVTYTIAAERMAAFTSAARMHDFWFGKVMATTEDGTEECVWKSKGYQLERAAKFQATLAKKGFEDHLARTGTRWEVEDLERLTGNQRARLEKRKRAAKLTGAAGAMEELLAEAHVALNHQGAEYLARRIKTLLDSLKLSEAEVAEVEAEAVRLAKISRGTG